MGRELCFDATKVAANTGIPSLVPRFQSDATTHVAKMFADEADDAPHADTDLPPGSVQLPIDSERMPPAGDGGKRRIVLAALVTPADVMENQAMRDLSWRVCVRRKVWLHQLTGDAKYGTIEHIIAIEDAGIRAYVPLSDVAHRTDSYGLDDFVFDRERDEYRCPQGHRLRRYSTKRTEGVVAYRGAAAVCNACPVKAKCTTSDHGRKVQRSFYVDYLEKVRGYYATDACQKAIRTRQVWVEPLFAEAKEWHGLRRLRLRGLLNANIQGLLIAAGQNLKRFLAARGWGRRHAPYGSLLAPPSEHGRVSVVTGW